LSVSANINFCFQTVAAISYRNCDLFVCCLFVAFYFGYACLIIESIWTVVIASLWVIE